jgi:hypothetical protein
MKKAVFWMVLFYIIGGAVGIAMLGGIVYLLIRVARAALG